MQKVDTIKFTTMTGMYRTGDVAGFDRETAAFYVSHGYANYVQQNVPRIDPEVAAHDASRRIAEISAGLDELTNTAEGAPDVPEVKAARAALSKLAGRLGMRQ